MEEQEQTNRPVISIDKDYTIGHRPEDTRVFTLFDGVPEFLAGQRAQTRKCVIATAADEPAAMSRLHKVGVSKYLQNGDSGVYGLQSLTTLPISYRDALGLDVKLTGKWYVHAESGLPFRVDAVNGSLPNGFDYFQSAAPGGVPKDFRLLRRHLAGLEADTLPLVHISDPVDLRNMKSDPRTVMVRVSPDGRWLTRWSINQLLDALFADSDISPGSVFDTVFADGRPNQLDMKQPDRDRILYRRTALCTIGEKDFTLGRGGSGERIIFENVPINPQRI